MKRIFSFALAALMIVLIASGCSKEGPAGEGFAYAKRPWNKTVQSQETITDADTITQTIGSFFSPIYYEIQVAADSVSGSTAATATLQQSIDDGSNWTTLGTVTINGVTTRETLTGNCLGGTIRLYTISTGTQSTTLDVSHIIAGKPE